MGDIINIDEIHSPAAAQVSSRRTFLRIRNAVIYALICMAVAAAVSYFLIVPVDPGNTNLKLICIPAFSYLLLGLLFTGFLYPKLNFFNKLNLSGGLQYTIAIFVGVFLITLVTGTINKNGSVLTALFYSCLFLIPYTIYQTWIFYKSLSGVGYSKIWYLPEYTNQVSVATVFLNSIRIRIKVAPLYGATENNYETTVPGRSSVGAVFTNFMYEEGKKQADKTEFENVNSDLFGWQFFTTDFFFGAIERPLDPDLSLYENGIKDNSVIIARRAQKQLA